MARLKDNNSTVELLDDRDRLIAVFSASRALFDLKASGATGDGVTDDSAAIEGFISARASGDVVTVPAGTYITDNFQIPAGVTVVGSRDAIFKMRAGANTTLVTLLAGAVLDGVTIDGNRANQTANGAGVSLSGDGAIVRNCKVQACYSYGITSANKNGVRIEKNEVTDTRFQAIFVEANANAIERVRITDNIVDRSAEGATTSGTGITLKGTASFKVTRSVISGNEVKMTTSTPPAGAICIETFGGVERCRVIGNDCTGGSMGISLDNTVMSACSGNTIYNAKSNGIELASSSQVTVSGNTIDGNALTVNGVSISNTTPRKNVVVGNNIRNCVTRGIIATTADWSSFTGNVIDMPSNYAIEIITSQHCSVSGNVCYGNGTATKGLTINTSDRCTVQGNTFFNFTENGILIFATTAVTLDRITICGNTFDTCNAPVAQQLSGGAVLGNLVVVWGNPGYSNTYSQHVLDLKNNVVVATGTGTPEAALGAGVGSIYHRRDGGALTSTYFKESGVGNTGWVAK